MRLSKEKDAYELLRKITGWYLGDPTVFPERLRTDIKKWIDVYEMPVQKDPHHPYCDCEACIISNEIHFKRKALSEKIVIEIMKHLGL